MRRWWMVLGVLWATGGVLQADQLSLVPVKDNTIFEDNDGLSNGSGSHLFSGATANRNSGLVRRALLAFDFSEIPAGSTVNEVSVTLNVNKVPRNQAEIPMGLHRLLQDFGEGASDAPGAEGRGTAAQAGDATWADAVLGTPWNQPGGDFVAAASASTLVGATGNYTWESTDALVADVQHWVDNPDESFGWALVGDESINRSAKRFTSRSGSRRNVPMLVVDFDLAGLLGDFNGDGELNVPDIDLLCSAIGGTELETFDLNDDQAISLDDLDVWVTDLAGTFAGDTDLDGEVAFGDFLNLSNNFGLTDRNWGHGDFDCSTTVAFSDFLSLSTNFGNEQVAAASVPEPNWIGILAPLLGLFAWRSRRAA